MASKTRARGTRFETAVVRYLTERLSTRVARVSRLSDDDVGDIHVGGRICVQAKDWARWGAAAVHEWMDDVHSQRKAAGLPMGVVVVKRRRSETSSGSMDDCIVMMPLSQYAQLLGSSTLFSSEASGAEE